MMPIVCLPMLLTGCVESAKPPASTPLPDIPTDIRTCFVGVVEIPPGRLTVGDVEKLWKIDRVRSIAMRRCGTRLIAYYDQLRRSWH